MDGSEPVRARIELDFDAQPIVGTLEEESGSPAKFTGWLGLTVALERLRIAHHRGETPDGQGEGKSGTHG